jgi:hypothetical protein
MNASTLPEIKKTLNMRSHRLLTLLSIMIFSAGTAFGQPNWWPVIPPPTPPTVAPVGALSATFNFGLTGTGTVYVIIYNSNVLGPIAPTTVRTQALLGPSGGKVVAVAIPVTAGQINMALQQVFTLFDVARPHALFCVAEGTVGGLQLVSTRVPFSTAACPDIYYANGLQLPSGYSICSPIPILWYPGF